MTIEAAADHAARAMVLTLLVSSPMLLAGLLVGVLISILQAVTQVQEMTLTFVPKIIAIMLAVIFLGRWMTAQLVLYTHALLMGIPDMAGR